MTHRLSFNRDLGQAECRDRICAEDHPTYKLALDVANARGSRATTVRGVLRFIKQDIYLLFERKTCVMTATQWKEKELCRKADPEAKRARDNPGSKFRRRYLERLRYREHKLLLCENDTIDQVCQYFDTMKERSRGLREIARLRSIIYGHAVSPQWLPKHHNFEELKNHRLVRLDLTPKFARKMGAKICMRGKNAMLASSFSCSAGRHSPHVTGWSKGKRYTKEAVVNDNWVRSFVLIHKDDPRVVDAIVHNTKFTCRAPAGYYWHIDAYGIRLCRDSVSELKDDYHPSVDELWAASKDGCAAIVNTIEYNAQRRREIVEHQRALRAADLAAAQGIYVCAADSIGAGNCRMGTLQFAKACKLDPFKHYEATEILALANGQSSRVRISISLARRRHTREVKQGYCSLADHVDQEFVELVVKKQCGTG